MHFLFPAVIIGLAASMMFVSASEIPTSPGESGTLSYHVLPEGRDQNKGFDSVDEYGDDAIKRSGRFARRGALMGVSGLSKRSEIGEIGERSKSKNSDGVGHRENGEELKSKSSDGVGHRENGQELKSKSSGGVGHRENGQELPSGISDGVGH